MQKIYGKYGTHNTRIECIRVRVETMKVMGAVGHRYGACVRK